MTAETALAVVGVDKAFGSLVVADGIDLHVPSGQRRGLIGINGAGKTTLFNMISGELRPDRGDVRLLGESITRASVKNRTLKGLGRTYQVSTLVPSLSVRANLVLATGNGRLPPMWRDWHADGLQADLMDVAERLRLVDQLDERVDALSHGVLRQLELAMVLAKHPRVLLLDEPAAGLARSEREMLAGILRELPREITVIMVEHDMDMVLGLSDEVSVLHRGRIFASGEPDEIARDDSVRDIYLGKTHDAATPSH